MARRHDALVPLTHDHHHALAQARRLRAAASADPSPRRDEANDFVNFYFGRAIRHFHEEEELFFAPLVDHPDVREGVLRAVSDHLRLHALVRSVKRQLSEGEVGGEILQQIATVLADHVRFEEQELFPAIERLIPADELVDLASARRDV